MSVDGFPQKNPPQPHFFVCRPPLLRLSAPAAVHFRLILPLTHPSPTRHRRAGLSAPNTESMNRRGGSSCGRPRETPREGPGPKRQILPADKEPSEKGERQIAVFHTERAFWQLAKIFLTKGINILHATIAAISDKSGGLDFPLSVGRFSEAARSSVNKLKHVFLSGGGTL